MSVWAVFRLRTEARDRPRWEAWEFRKQPRLQDVFLERVADVLT